MEFCVYCWRQGRLSPVTSEQFRPGQKGFNCRWCGRQSGEAVSDTGGSLASVECRQSLRPRIRVLTSPRVRSEGKELIRYPPYRVIR